jgi:hypothetical protein
MIGILLYMTYITTNDKHIITNDIPSGRSCKGTKEFPQVRRLSLSNQEIQLLTQNQKKEKKKKRKIIIMLCTSLQ